MKLSVLFILLLIVGCSTSQMVQAPIGSTIVIEKSVCSSHQCGLLDGVDCGNCEHLKGYTCGDNDRPNICGNICTEMVADDRCLTINGGAMNHQFHLQCHDGSTDKYWCVTMTDGVNPESSVRCCNIPPESNEE